MEEFVVGFFVAYFIILFAALAYSIASYVLNSLGMYTIAKRRGIDKPWLAWIPVVNVWILGSLSDQYRYVVKNQVKSKRKTLLVLSIINTLLTTAVVVCCIVMIVRLVTGSMQGMSDNELGREVMGGVLTMLAMAVPLMLLSLVKMIIGYIALYDVYTSCDPANNVLYLILSIIPAISTITQPLFLFLCRNQDGGMPPRREEPAAEPSEEPQDYHYTQL